jgi:hypothetical protein
MGQSFFVDDSVLCHSPCGHRPSFSFGNSGVLGILCLDPSVPFASLILYAEGSIKGCAQGVLQKLHDEAEKIVKTFE